MTPRRGRWIVRVKVITWNTVKVRDCTEADAKAEPFKFAYEEKETRCDVSVHSVTPDQEP